MSKYITLSWPAVRCIPECITMLKSNGDLTCIFFLFASARAILVEMRILCITVFKSTSLLPCTILAKSWYELGASIVKGKSAAVSSVLMPAVDLLSFSTATQCNIEDQISSQKQVTLMHGSCAWNYGITLHSTPSIKWWHCQEKMWESNYMPCWAKLPSLFNSVPWLEWTSIDRNLKFNQRYKYFLLPA